MNISSNYNGFYHGPVLNELLKKAIVLTFDDWIDCGTNKPFTFNREEHYSTLDELKQLLKDMNINYAVDGDKKISTKDIDSKALSQHIEWCIRLAGFNGIEFGFIEDEWARLLEQAHNYKGR